MTRSILALAFRVCAGACCRADAQVHLRMHAWLPEPVQECRLVLLTPSHMGAMQEDHMHPPADASSAPGRMWQWPRRRPTAPASGHGSLSWTLDLLHRRGEPIAWRTASRRVQGPANEPVCILCCPQDRRASARSLHMMAGMTGATRSNSGQGSCLKFLTWPEGGTDGADAVCGSTRSFVSPGEAAEAVRKTSS